MESFQAMQPLGDSNPLQRKGIILAGGSGSRLWPMTAAISKQLLPVWDKPMIYYPLATLMQAGLTDILIISTPLDLPRFEALFGCGKHLGLRIQYAEQAKPNGLAEAFLIAESFLDGHPAALILGDNIFYGHGLTEALQQANTDPRCTVFAYAVHDPERYGVVSFDRNGHAISLEEKPIKPKSKYAVTGIYFYDSQVCRLAKTLAPSQRGELEITDLNRLYLEAGNLRVHTLNREITWLDTGTAQSLLQAAQFVETVQTRQGLVIACLEEIALECGLISRRDMRTLIQFDSKSSYATYVQTILQSSEHLRT
jgi:glucose-1-phosphate thymidylyltransferase